LKGINKGQHHSKILQNAVNKYGKDNFEFKVIEYIECPIECRTKEQEWITILTPKYNMTHDVSRAVIYTPELSRKMSEAHGGKPFEVYKNNDLIGIFYSQAQCARDLNISQSKIGEVLKGNRNTSHGYMFKYIGKEFSYKVKPRKIADLSNRIWKKHSEETKKKISKAGIGRVTSEKTKELQSKIKKEKYEKGTLHLVDYSNREIAIKQARNKFKGIARVYKNGELIGEFLSIKEISETLNIKSNSIAQVICGRRKKIFKYTIEKEGYND
jgi:transcriptional regulator with XRE-family HTH domain